MSTRKADISARSLKSAPALARMSRTFSITARVWVRMSRCVVPNSSTSAPAMELSARRALVPERKRKSPARLRWGNRPRGVALPSTTVAFILLTGCITPLPMSESNTDVVQLGIEVQGMHATFAANTRKSHPSERRAQVTQEPAIHPGDAGFHLPRHVMRALQIAGPDRGCKTVLGVIGHGNGFFLRVEGSDMTHRPENFLLHAGRRLRQARPDRRLHVKAVVAGIAKRRNSAASDDLGSQLARLAEVR